MFSIYFSLAIKEITRRRRRALYTISGIILSSALLTFTYLVSTSLKKSFNQVLAGVGADIVVQMHGDPCVWAPVKLPTNLNPLPVEMIEQVKKIQGVKQASGILIVWVFSGEEGNLHPMVVAGVEPWERELGPLQLSKTEGGGNWLVKGRYFNDQDLYATVLDYDFAKFLNTDIGGKIYFGDKQFEIIGIIKTGREARIAGAQAFMPLRVAQELLKRGKVVDTIFLKLDSNADLKKTVKVIKEFFGENSSVTTSADFPSTVIGLSVFTNLFIFGIFMIVGIFALGFSLRSISASISERIKEISVMRAIGWEVRRVRALLFSESVIVSALGSLLGAGVGIILSVGYIHSVRLNLPEALVNYPPCSMTPPKVEMVLSWPGLNIPALIAIIVGLTLLSGIASIIVSRSFLKLECAEGLRSL